jgi:hypothetical protein
MSHSPKKHLLHALSYTFIITFYFFTPASLIPFHDHWLSDIFTGLFIYFVFSWLLLVSLGSCPLRWRRITVWVLVIILAYAYWVEFLQSLLPALERKSSFYHLFTALVGGGAGIVVRLKYTYNHCNCHLMHQIPQTSLSDRSNDALNDKKTELKQNEIAVPKIHTIADHPHLNNIIADALGWKSLTLFPLAGLSVEMVCTGKSLVSLPHFSYGSLSSPMPVRNENDILHFMSAFALPRNIAQMEIRLPSADPKASSHKTSSWLKLEQSVEMQWANFSPNLRRKIRKSQKNGFTIRQGGTELLKVFWNLYALHMDKLGSAALPLSYYEAMSRNYTEGLTAVFIMYDGKKPVGAAYNLAYKGFYENDCFATLHSVQQKYASYFLHYHMISHAIQTGAHIYSFGRSTTGGGVHQFKKQWGADDVPLIWAHYPAQKLNMRKQGWMQKIWRLVPWPIRSRLNPYLAKWFY